MRPAPLRMDDQCRRRAKRRRVADRVRRHRDQTPMVPLKGNTKCPWQAQKKIHLFMPLRGTIGASPLGRRTQSVTRRRSSPRRLWSFRREGAGRAAASSAQARRLGALEMFLRGEQKV